MVPATGQAPSGSRSAILSPHRTRLVREPSAQGERCGLSEASIRYDFTGDNIPLGHRFHVMWVKQS